MPPFSGLGSFHPETLEFPSPPEGGGSGWGDNDWDFKAFHFYSLTRPSPTRGEGVSGWALGSFLWTVDYGLWTEVLSHVRCRTCQD